MPDSSTHHAAEARARQRTAVSRNELTPGASLDTPDAMGGRAGKMGSFHFGEFHLDRGRRLLFRGRVPVPLAPKALELLELLIAERDRTLSKAELLDRLWPDTVVAENNLTVTMSALRKALGESAARPRYLQTLSRRGYRFVEHAGQDEKPQKEAPASSLSPARLRQVAMVVAGSERAAAQEAAALVGRDAERARLGQHWARALAGHGQVVFITGEPGIGKTALCESFLATLGPGARGLILMRGRSLEQFGRGEAYLPWLEAWSGLLAGPHADRARTLLRREAPSWCRELPALLAAERPAPQGELPGGTRDRWLREMASALAALALEAPLLIVLEDLHWADAASCDLLRWACQHVRQQRWLIIGTFRNVDAGLLNPPLENLRREALAHGECEEIRLGALGEQHVAACLSAQFPENDFPAELTARLYRRTEGHPLFLTRLLAFLVQREHLVQRSGVWTLTRSLDQLELETPEDVRAMVRKKLDSLDEESRTALAYASVEGQEFSSRVLSELLGIDELLLEERLYPLCTGHRLLDVLGEEVWPDGQLSTRYRFAHVLYQNELYAGLVSRRRVLLHLRTAEALLARTADEHLAAERSRLAATLAVHFERGRDLPRAIEFLCLAGQNAHRLCAYAEEERLYLRALELCTQLPEAQRRQPVARALYGLGWALHDAGEGRRAERSFRELLAHAQRVELHDFEHVALDALCGVTFLTGYLDESRSFAERQRQTAAQRGNRHWELRGFALLMGTAAAAGQFSDVLGLGEQVLPAMEQEGNAWTLAIALGNVGWAHAFQSEFAAAEAAYARSLELWRDISGIMRVECLHALGWIRAHRGQLSAGLQAFFDAAELSRTRQIEFHLLRLPDGIGWIRRELGDPAAASAHHRAGIEHARAHGATFFELCFVVELARDCLELGELAEAERQLARARDLFAAGELGIFPCYERRAQLRFCAARAHLGLARGEAGQARAAARELLELAALDPSREYQAIAHELLARAAFAERQAGAALAALSPALELLERYPMPLVAWRIHALAAEIHAVLGGAEPARQAAQAARALVEQMAANLGDRELESGFLASPSVRRVLGRLPS